MRRSAGKFPRIRAFRWKGKALWLLDQRELPHKTVWRKCRTWEDVARDIRWMVVRGAPAIGCVTGYGIALAAAAKKFRTLEEQQLFLEKASAGLFRARPTAVNLRWALDRMHKIWGSWCHSRESGNPKTLDPRFRGDDNRKLAVALEKEAIAIEQEDRASNHVMGRYGAALLPSGATVMTICNTGSLATAGLGTAFGVIWTAFQEGKIKKVIASETRPYLQGARLTTYELKTEKIPFELMTDNMAAHLMKTEKIDAVLVGADRIAANGDSANKIGTYSLAVLAAHHRVPFYVVAPFSTVDMNTPSGERIPIEERSADEVTMIRGQRITPHGTKARHPAFDITPASLITGIITERGVAQPPYTPALQALSSGLRTPAVAVLSPEP